METTTFLGETVGERALEEPATPTFKPSDINLNFALPNPFVDLFEHAEAEVMAVMLVRFCQVLGDTWQPVDWGDERVKDAMRADFEAKRQPIFGLMTNPFLRPDIHDLIRRGYAEWVGKPGTLAQFTQKGMDKLAKRLKV